MANEINFFATTGQTVTCQLYNGATPYGTPFASAEIGTTGSYVASMPTAPYGKYFIVATATGTTVATGEIMWSGDYEITEAVAMLRGLDPNNPATQTLTSLTSGNIDIAVSGDLENTTIFTAQL